MTVSDRHGGDLYAAARELGRSPRHLIDFSASINPLGPSKRAIRAAVKSLPLACHYPDATCHGLATALVSRWKLDPAHFVVGNGSSELIHLLPRALSIRHALILGPTFSEYARALSMQGSRMTYLHATRKDGYQIPLTQACKALCTNRSRFDTLFLCNPNSPTGQVASSQDVLDLVDVAARRKVWVVVDETFVDYCEAHSVLSAVVRSPRLLVLRSFTKFYALPGLRTGYLAGSPEVVARIRRFQPPWSVNALAQTAAQAALKDRRHAQRSLVFMHRERARLVKALRTIPGLHVFPSAANFFLVELPSSMLAAHVTQTLRQQGLLIRDCSAIPGLTDRTIRIAVRTTAENRRLVRALCQLLKACRPIH
ncbi:MAG: threonine-phosphate decarboxylase [Nitrospirae bacterium]|nr:MAG: threonine-phosphate decarboxylase [Nitrospirota bacterium]